MEKLFFIAIIPPDELAGQITAIKQDFADRFQSRRALRVVPHITLKAPFKIAEVKRKGLIDWFQRLSLGIDSFNLILTGFGAFPNPKNPVVFVKPETSKNLNMLQHKLIDKFSNLLPRDVSTTDMHFHPHMTVAYRDLTPENFEKSWAEYHSKYFSETFPVNGFHLLEHDGAKWGIIATNRLQ